MLRSSLDVVQVKFTGESLPRWQGTRAGTGSRSEPEILNAPPTPMQWPCIFSVSGMLSDGFPKTGELFYQTILKT